MRTVWNRGGAGRLMRINVASWRGLAGTPGGYEASHGLSGAGKPA